MAKTRTLETRTLDQAARDYAGNFLRPTVYSQHEPDVATGGRGWVIHNLYSAHFMDEHEHLVAAMKGQLGQDAWADFQSETKNVFVPRRKDEFEAQLEARLAIRPNGERIPGKLGSVQIGERVVGYRQKVIEIPEKRWASGKTKPGRTMTVTKSIREPAYAGDLDYMASIGALNFNMNAETALLGLDAIVDNMDSEAGAGVIKGYTGAQPADPDAATTGTLLFTCVCSNPAFPASVDDTDGTVSATASAITSDTSADATNTLTYVRASASADGAAETDPQIDGSAGTATVDWVFNTAAIVSGATVAISSWVMNLDQGASAT